MLFTVRTAQARAQGRGREGGSVIEDEDCGLTSRKLLQIMRVSLVTPQ